MSFDGVDYIQVAKDLFNKRTPSNSPLKEAELRAAISRAYYGAFLKTRHYLIYVAHYQNVPQDGTAHLFVRTEIQNFANSRGKPIIGQELYKKLDTLRILRNRVDYREICPGLQANALIAITHAND